MDTITLIQAGTPTPYSARYMAYLRHIGWSDIQLERLEGDILRFEYYVMRAGTTAEDGLDVLVDEYDETVTAFFIALESKVKKLAFCERNFTLQKKASKQGDKEADRIMSGEQEGAAPSGPIPTLQLILAGSEEDPVDNGDDAATVN